MDLPALLSGRRSVDGGAHKRMTEGHAFSEREQRVRLRVRGGESDPKSLGGSQQQQRIADRLGRRGIGLLHVMLGYLGAFLTIQLFVGLQLTSAATLLWLLFGFVGQSGILAYPFLSRYFGVGVAGRANTALNFITFITAFLVQSIIGAIIDLWPVTETGGYPPQAYQAGFGLFLGLQVLALIWYLLRPPDQRMTAATAEKGRIS